MVYRGHSKSHSLLKTSEFVYAKADLQHRGSAFGKITHPWDSVNKRNRKANSFDKQRVETVEHAPTVEYALEVSKKALDASTERCPPKQPVPRSL